MTIVRNSTWIKIEGDDLTRTSGAVIFFFFFSLVLCSETFFVLVLGWVTNFMIFFFFFKVCSKTRKSAVSESRFQ